MQVEQQILSDSSSDWPHLDVQDLSTYRPEWDMNDYSAICGRITEEPSTCFTRNFDFKSSAARSQAFTDTDSDPSWFYTPEPALSLESKADQSTNGTKCSTEILSLFQTPPQPWKGTDQWILQSNVQSLTKAPVSTEKM